MRGRKGLPNDEVWLSTEQAAELWERITAGTLVRPVSGQTMRSWCRTGALEGHGVRVMVGGGRFYFVARRSLLEYVRRSCAEVVARVEKEMDAPS